MNVDAVLWDFDGTLVNSVPKNIDITKEILSVVTPRLTGENLPDALKSEDSYHIANHQSKNWQDLYINYYGMSEVEMIEAGALWTEYQLKNTIPVKLFSDIKHTISKIHVPQGICSQNASDNIKCVLKENGLLDKFNSIIGYNDIPNNYQKPIPFGGIKCLQQIFENTANKTIIYIGDHEGDIEFARNIEMKLDNNSKVIAVTAKYSSADTRAWTYRPDFEIETPSDLLKIL
ncbi:HAD family hydrolase [Flavobacteriaceae bacterium 3-367]|uniref:HAD family hydrolase n=1 Tax=Eudoraea algarum TaxID=3417568 RepID=UPI00326FF354